MEFNLNSSLDPDKFDENLSGNDVSHSSELGKESTHSAALLCLEFEKAFEIGHTMESIDQVYLLYCEYARYRGFSVRKGDQSYFSGTKDIRMKEFKCSCEGHHDDKRSKSTLPVYKKQITRSDCKARLRIAREKDSPWKVQRFFKDHNHELVPVEQSYLLRSARHLSHANKSLLEALNSAGIGVSRACRFMENEGGGPQNLGFIRKDAYHHLSRQKMKTSMENKDANELVQFLTRKANSEPYFYWKPQPDDDGRLMNFFFRDSLCLIDYEFFGDVLSVDSTYRTNRYNLICVPFIGLNHHRKNVLFGLGFLSNETAVSFEWLFATFLESMHGKEPQVIFTDQCQALMNGIDASFHTASHRLCQWHINQNAPSHFGDLNGNNTFKKLWHHCMNGVDSEAEFEACWTEMIKKYDLVGNSWFSTMYRLRKRWATVFTNTCFSAGLHATSRSESTNRVLKDLCSASTSLAQFVEKYEQILTDWRRRESADDAMNIGTPGLFLPNNLLLMQASKVFTRAIFKMFETEVALAISVVIIDPPVNVSEMEFQFKVASQPSMLRIRTVHFRRQTNTASCSCHMWETEGVLCRHIFRIYVEMKVTRLPDCYIIRRWCKVAKQRHSNDVHNYYNSDASDFVDEMSFVNYSMRLTLDLAHQCKHLKEGRNLFYERLNSLKNEMTTLLKKDDGDECSKHRATSRELYGQKFRDPPNIKCRGRNNVKISRHWDKKKSSVKKRAQMRKWPEVPCSEQTSSQGHSTAHVQEEPSVSMLHDPVFGWIRASYLEKNASTSQNSRNENLDETIDVTSVFQPNSIDNTNVIGKKIRI